MSYSPAAEYTLGARVDLGKVGGYLNSAAATFTFVAKIDGVITYSETASKALGQTSLSYNFDRIILVQSGEVLTLEVLSSNAADLSIYGDVYIIGHRSSGGVLATTERSDMVDWIKNEFAPRTMAVSDSVINQQLDNAIRYFNTYSGYKISQTVDWVGGDGRIQVSEEFKQVVDVIPGQATTWLLKDHPMLSLLGISVLDNVTSDLILMTESFKMYRTYMGADFNWHWEKSEDPTVGGYLYVKRPPAGTSTLTLVGTKRIRPSESITQEFLQDWILRYAKALTMIIEGQAIRIGKAIGISQDGDDFVREGREDATKLKDELKRNGMWVLLVKRR